MADPLVALDASTEGEEAIERPCVVVVPVGNLLETVDTVFVQFAFDHDSNALDLLEIVRASRATFEEDSEPIVNLDLLILVVSKGGIVGLCGWLIRLWLFLSIAIRI